VGQALQRALFSQKESVVLTSATLSTEGNIEYIKGCLGLEGIDELIINAPFDYKSSTLIYLPGDIPEPDKPGYQQGVEQTLIELCQATQGHTLVLFTSHTALRTTYAAIQVPLGKQGILVLGQGIDGGPKRLLNTFRINPKTVLLGAASLWEGIDVVGEALSVLVMVRLPFGVPTDPISSARAELFEDSFNQYTLPQAILRFKQGFGRLIRSRQDRGVLVILDRRVQTKPYGKAFLGSLPPCTVRSGRLRQLPKEAAWWLGY
jgi:DNA polymerase-3 subunit epsilon/ATP-dependent DNA helicase DinG